MIGLGKLGKSKVALYFPRHFVQKIPEASMIFGHGCLCFFVNKKVPARGGSSIAGDVLGLMTPGQYV